MDGAIPEECRAQKTVAPLQNHLCNVRATGDSYRRDSPNFTEGIRTNVPDGLIRFLLEFVLKIRKLIKKQRDTIELNVTTDLEDADAFHFSLEYKLSCRGTCSYHHLN